MADPFIKVKLGHHRGMPAVVITNKSGQPFLWFTGATHREAMKVGRAYIDAAQKEIADAANG